MADNFIDAALNVRATQVLLLQKERHETHESVLGRSDQVFVSHDVQWLLVLLIAMAEENLEELFHLECLLCDEPVPPLRVVSGEVEFWLVAMAQSVAESAERWEHVERVSHTDESLLCGVGHGALDAEWMVRLGNPDVVITVALTLQPHDLERGGSVDADR